MRNPNTFSGSTGEVLPWLEAAHDTIFAEHNRKRLKRVVIQFSALGFTVHLLLIFLAHLFNAPQHWMQELGPSYLSTISTPFNFILFYEVLTLIAALPASTTRSIASQYEIVSLIFIRDVFRDVALGGDLVSTHTLTEKAQRLSIDMWGGLFMFLLVAVFQHIATRRRTQSGIGMPSRATLRFIGQKKIIAAGLATLLVAMAIWNVSMFIITVVRILRGGQGTLESATTFYNDMFTVMIFTDVLVLILSLVVSDRYEMVFRNAAFVASIVLIRFALTEGHPFGAPMAILAMLFGIGTLLVFNFHVRNNGPVDA
jgi:hypothetical protein